MTKDDYLRIARECGLTYYPELGVKLSNFASTIAALEREECAKMCDELAKDSGYCDGPGPKTCAEAIRNKDVK